jgi:Ni/Fe-hydrogenase subunit HybB-like protein
MQWSIGSYEMPPPFTLMNALITGVALIVAISRVPKRCFLPVEDRPKNLQQRRIR